MIYRLKYTAEVTTRPLFMHRNTRRDSRGNLVWQVTETAAGAKLWQTEDGAARFVGRNNLNDRFVIESVMTATQQSATDADDGCTGYVADGKLYHDHDACPIHEGMD